MMNKYKENLVELFGQEELRGLRGTLLKVNNLNARFIAKNKGNAIQFLQTVARRDVTGIVDMITRPGSDINLKYAKRLFDKETLKDINTGLVQSIIEKSYTGELFSPQKLGKNFKKYDRALQQLLSPEDYNEIVQTYRAMVKNAVAVERMATNPSQTGQVGLSYMIMKRLWDATTEALKLNFGGAIKEVFGAIYMPKIVAKMYLNPTARRYLTIGFNTPWNAPEAEKVYEGIAKAIGVQVSDLKRERQ